VDFCDGLSSAYGIANTMAESYHANSEVVEGPPEAPAFGGGGPAAAAAAEMHASSISSSPFIIMTNSSSTSPPSYHFVVSKISDRMLPISKTQ